MVKHVLIVEDSPDLLRLMDVYLRSQGYETSTAPDAGTALQIVHDSQQDHPVDLVMTDNDLPSRNEGIALCHQLHDEGLNIPAVLITGRAQDVQGRELENTDIRNVLCKPAPLERITKAVEDALEPPPGNFAERLRKGVDPRQGPLWDR